MQPIITIFVAFTRTWALDLWLENLNGVKHDPSRTNICLIVDDNEPLIVETFKYAVEEKGYRSFYYRMNDDWSPNEMRLAVRRMRVADIKNQSKELIAKTDGEIIISLEDDTVFDRLQSFDRLIDPLEMSNTTGFVEGVQMGRWGANMIGAWEADKIFAMQRIKTLLPGTDYQKITGGGFYGYATRRDLYLEHEYYTSSAQPWGPDVNFGLWLNQLGFDCWIDWDTIFGHNDHGKILYPDTLPPHERLTEVIYNKDSQTGRWERTDNEPNRY